MWQWMIFGSIRGLSMAKYLVIVESPAKVKTIKKFLGSNYEVAASNGHIRDDMTVMVIGLWKKDALSLPADCE